MGAQALLFIGTLKPTCQFGRRFQILIKEAVQQQIRGRKEWPPKCGRIVVVSDGDIVSPHQQANRTLIAGNPRRVKAQKLIEVGRQPVHGADFIGDQKCELPKNRLGLILRFGPVLLQASEGIGTVHIHYHGDATFIRLVIEKIDDAADRMLTHLLAKGRII